MKKILLILSTILISKIAKSQYAIDSSLNSFVKEWVGYPYRFGGTSKKGIDCSAFTQKLYSSVYNIDIPRTCSTQFQIVQKINLENIRVGDILFFTSILSPSGWHCGVYLGNDWFVHAANARAGVTISCLFDPMYQRIFKKAGRIKK